MMFEKQKQVKKRLGSKIAKPYHMSGSGTFYTRDA